MNIQNKSTEIDAANGNITKDLRVDSDNNKELKMADTKVKTTMDKQKPASTSKKAVASEGKKPTGKKTSTTKDKKPIVTKDKQETTEGVKNNKHTEAFSLLRKVNDRLGRISDNVQEFNDVHEYVWKADTDLCNKSVTIEVRYDHRNKLQATAIIDYAKLGSLMQSSRVMELMQRKKCQYAARAHKLTVPFEIKNCFDQKAMERFDKFIKSIKMLFTEPVSESGIQEPETPVNSDLPNVIDFDQPLETVISAVELFFDAAVNS